MNPESTIEVSDLPDPNNTSGDVCMYHNQTADRTASSGVRLLQDSDSDPRKLIGPLVPCNILWDSLKCLLNPTFVLLSIVQHLNYLLLFSQFIICYLQWSECSLISSL
ncbi:hypothetical protein NQD34_014847 [Periophthalmus magnuspinnatus]|nr:hypothetical protein NQD34_014847 [Periophthalmus magnuspinnatus]